MADAIQNYLTLGGPACRRRLTALYRNEVVEFTYLIGKLQDTLNAFYLQSTEGEKNDPRGTAYGLMYQGANTLMAAFELALSGYSSEPPILFRSAIERCAAAWDIVFNEKAHKCWEAGKGYESSDSISRLAKVDRFYGKIWGFLSNKSVHITRQNSNPVLHLIDSRMMFQWFGFVPVGKEETMRHIVESAILATHACLRLTEVVFFPFASDPETVVLNPTGTFATPIISERHRRFVDAFEQTLERLRKNPELRH